MAEIQVVRFTARPTLDAALVRHVEGHSRPDTARPVEAEALGEIVDLGGDKHSAFAALAEARPTGRGGRPYEAVEVVMAGPPPYGDDGSWPFDRELAWARASCDWLLSVIGPRAAVVASSLHRDETSPHLHVLFVPIDSAGKLRWTGVQLEAMERLGVPRSRRKKTPPYRVFQDDYHARVGVRFGLGRGEVGSVAKHEDIDRAKAAERRVVVARFREEGALSRALMHDEVASLAREREESALGRALEVEAAADAADSRLSESVARRDEVQRDLYDLTSQMVLESESTDLVESELAEAKVARDAARTDAARAERAAEEARAEAKAHAEAAAGAEARAREHERQEHELAARLSASQEAARLAEERVAEREAEAERLRKEGSRQREEIEAGRRGALGRAGERGRELLRVVEASRGEASSQRERAERERRRAASAEAGLAEAAAEKGRLASEVNRFRLDAELAVSRADYWQKRSKKLKNKQWRAYKRGVERGFQRCAVLMFGAMWRWVARAIAEKTFYGQSHYVPPRDVHLRRQSLRETRLLLSTSVDWWRGEVLQRPKPEKGRRQSRWWREVWLPAPPPGQDRGPGPREGGRSR